ncbi:MAG: hypothetical protein ACYC7D_08570 [Nitrososphaerales archaeon]
MTVRIVVGGPPNSGKSTFVINLKRALQDTGVNAEFAELDPFASTLALLEGLMSEEERKMSKRKEISEDEIKKVAERLVGFDGKVEIVLGDLPGKITPQTKSLCRHATHAIIVCKDQAIEDIKAWRSFFDESDVPVISEIVSKIEGEESCRIGQNKVIEAVIVGLNREVQVTPQLHYFALHLRSALDL